jgi:hypothetical protein
MKYLFYVEKPKKYSIEYSKDNGGLSIFAY